MLMAVSWVVFSADVPDLGVISPRRGIVLGTSTHRADFISFKLEFLPQTAPTNLVTLTVTNELLTVDQLVRVPSGRGILGVTAVYADDESEPALFRYDLRRSKPPAPSLTPTAIGTTNQEQTSLTNQMRKIREGRRVPVHAPLPPGFFGAPTQEVAQAVLRPLPGATNWTYSQHLDWLADRQSKRRSE